MKMEGVQVPPSRTVRPHTGRFRNYVPIIHRGPDFFLSKPHPVVRSQPTIGVRVRIPPPPSCMVSNQPQICVSVISRFGLRAKEEGGGRPLEEEEVFEQVEEGEKTARVVCTA